jgi:hypothetical protein
MSKEKFVDNNLVKIRGRLMEASNEKSPSNDISNKEKKRDRSSGGVAIQDKEWKKAIFKRWDEYKVLRRDAILKLNEVLNTIPDDCESAEKKISELKHAETKLKEVLASVESLDDSEWDRHNLTKELSSAVRKVENARMDCMLTSSKLGAKKLHSPIQSANSSTSSLIHELSSLNFSQCFKLGLGFSFPLIIGIIIASLIFSLFYYISLH